MFNCIVKESQPNWVEAQVTKKQKNVQIEPLSLKVCYILGNFVFDSELKDVLIGFHPLQNDNTIVLDMKNVEHFLSNIGSEFSFEEL